MHTVNDWKRTKRRFCASLSGAIAVSILLSLCSGPGGASGQATVFVANDGSSSVSVIDPEMGAAVAGFRIGRSLAHPVNQAPPYPSRRFGLFGGEPLAPLTARQVNAVRATSFAQDGLPRAIVTTRDGRLLITSQFPDILSVVDSVTNEPIVDPITVGPAPEGIAVTPDDRCAFVTNYDGASVSVIDLERYEVVQTINVSPNPNAIAAAATPGGVQVYLTHQLRDPQTQFPIAGKVSVIAVGATSCAGSSLLDTVQLNDEGGLPMSVSFTPEGDRAIVVSFERGQIAILRTEDRSFQGCFGIATDYLTNSILDAQSRLYLTDFQNSRLTRVPADLLNATNSCLTGSRAMRISNGGFEEVQLSEFPSSLGYDPQTDHVFVGSYALADGCSGSFAVEGTVNCRAAFGNVRMVDAGAFTDPGAPEISVERFPVGIAVVPAAQSLQRRRLASQLSGEIPCGSPTLLNCYQVHCTDPDDCIVPIGKHQPKSGGVAAGEGQHSCAGDRYAPTPTCGRMTPTPTPSPAPACIGDCDGDGMVRVNEIVVGVNIALGGIAITACQKFDKSQDGQVTVDEILFAINNLLSSVCRSE